MNTIAKTPSLTAGKRQATTRLFVTAFVFTLLSSIGFRADAACVRHAYNHSKTAWQVAYNGCSGKTGSCTFVPPGESRTIIYESESAGSNTVLFRTVSNDPRRYSGIPGYERSFFMEGCYIKHDGGTGRAVLNVPANGDVTFLD